MRYNEEMKFVDVDGNCSTCHKAQFDVVAVEIGDERLWTCPDCGAENALYWDDNPISRGWK